MNHSTLSTGYPNIFLLQLFFFDLRDPVTQFGMKMSILQTEIGPVLD